MIAGIGGLVLRVCDVERSLAFYRDGLGLAVEEKLDAGVRLRVGKGARLDLIGGGQRREKAYDFERMGYHHFCLAVGDIQKLADHLYKIGILDAPTPTHNKDLNDGLWLEDPDGNAVEIVGYRNESPLMMAGSDCLNCADAGITGIAHVSFVVENMERSLQYYQTELGFERVLDLDDDEGKPFLIFLRVVDGEFIELFYTGKRKEAQNEGIAGCEYALFVREQKRETVPFNGQSNVKNEVKWIVDPDGNRFEMVELI